MLGMWLPLHDVAEPAGQVERDVRDREPICGDPVLTFEMLIEALSEFLDAFLGILQIKDGGMGRHIGSCLERQKRRIC